MVDGAAKALRILGLCQAVSYHAIGVATIRKSKQAAGLRLLRDFPPAARNQNSRLLASVRGVEGCALVLGGRCRSYSFVCRRTNHDSAEPRF